MFSVGRSGPLGPLRGAEGFLLSRFMESLCQQAAAVFFNELSSAGNRRVGWYKQIRVAFPDAVFKKKKCVSVFVNFQKPCVPFVWD